MARKVASVIAGFALWTVLWLSGSAGVRAAMPGSYDGDIPVSAGLLALILVMSVAISMISGWVLALTACKNVMKPTWVLALILLAVGIAVQAGYWDQMPVWYHLTFLALLVPGTLIGAKLRRGGGAVATPAATT